MEIFRRARSQHSPGAIWRAISTVESLPGWLPGVESAEHLSGPKEGVGRRQRIQRLLYSHRIEIEQQVVEWDPERVLSMLHLRETSGGRELAGLRNFKTIVRIEPRDKGCSLVAEFSWETRGFTAMLFSRLFAGRTMGRELRDLLRKIEAHVSGKA
jgi:carbon monoxide dehydrogenase subunit G